MNPLLKRIAVLLAVLVVPLTVAGCGYNTIPTLEENARAKWGDVQNEYQRRADVIPNLVNTVKGYAAQEKSVLVEVTEARAKATSVKVDASTITDPSKFQAYQNAQNGLNSSLSRLMVVVEKYPDLKSNQNFLALQSQLEGTENRIAVARRDYNDAARKYNTSLRTFPTSIWAGSVYKSSKPMEYFQATASSATAPTVSFDAPAAPAPAPAKP